MYIKTQKKVQISGPGIPALRGNNAMCPELFIMILFARMIILHACAFYKLQSIFIFFSSPEYNYPHFKGEDTKNERNSVIFPGLHH